MTAAGAFAGVLAPVATPFRADLAVDTERFVAHCRRLLDMVATDEEVLVMHKRGASTPGGIQVSGATGSVDVLRWDGSCVTVSPGELSYDPPSRIENARIVWNRLEVAFRDALKEDEEVYDLYVQHKKTCKGVSFGKVSKKCVKADEALSRAIAEHVREDGGNLPPPKKLPEL